MTHTNMSLTSEHCLGEVCETFFCAIEIPSVFEVSAVEGVVRR